LTEEPSESGYVAFRYRDFSLFFAGRFLSGVAVQVQNVAVGWLVYDVTRDPLALGLVGLATFLPAVSLALVTGHVADRFDRRSILVACYALCTLSALGLLVFAASGARPRTAPRARRPARSAARRWRRRRGGPAPRGCTGRSRRRGSSGGQSGPPRGR
jgi:MFS family permease